VGRGGAGSLAIFYYWHYIYPTWHSRVLVVGDLLMIGVWYYGYRLAQKDKIIASVLCFGVGVSLQSFVGLLLLDGFEMAAFLPMLAGTVYVGLLDKRPLYVCIGISIFAPAVAAIVRWYGLIHPVQVPSEYLIVPTAGMALLVGGFILFFVFRSHALSGKMFDSLADANRDQQKIIGTVQQILPEIGRALERIEQTSAKVSYQAGQLATVTSQINATMNDVNEKALETTKTAQKTNTVAESTYEMSQRNFKQFRDVEVGFEKGMKSISDAALEVTNLAAQMEHIEEILSFNRQIGEQITLLAVNATIEADEAGSYGKVFGEVAREFKGMIRDTEENLTQSRALLHTIRDQARESAQTLVEGSSKLEQNFEELKLTGGIVEENLYRFQLTAERLAEIDEAARRQQHNVQEVSAGMAEINRASEDLNLSAAILERNVARIGASGKELGEVLEGIDTSSLMRTGHSL